MLRIETIEAEIIDQAEEHEFFKPSEIHRSIWCI